MERGIDGASALHFCAAFNDSDETCRLLIEEFEFTVDLLDDNKVRPLQEAVIAKNQVVSKILYIGYCVVCMA